MPSKSRATTAKTKTVTYVTPTDSWEDLGNYIYAIRPPVTAKIARELRKGLIAICNEPDAKFKGADLYGAAPLMGQLLWAAEMVPHLADLTANGGKIHTTDRPGKSFKKLIEDVANQRVSRRAFYAAVAEGCFPQFTAALKTLLADDSLIRVDKAGFPRSPFFPRGLRLIGNDHESLGSIADAGVSPKNDIEARQKAEIVKRAIAFGRESLYKILEDVPDSPDGSHLRRTWWHAVALERGLRHDLELIGRSGFTKPEDAIAFIAGLAIWWGTTTDEATQISEGLYYGLLHQPDGTIIPNLWDDFLCIPLAKDPKSREKKPSHRFSMDRVEETRLALAAMSATLQTHKPADPELVEAATAAAFRARQLPRPDFLIGTLMARFMIDWPIASPTFTDKYAPPPGTPDKHLGNFLEDIEDYRRDSLRKHIAIAKERGLSLVEHDLREVTKVFINGIDDQPGRHTGARVMIIEKISQTLQIKSLLKR